MTPHMQAVFNVVHNRYPMTDDELLELAGIQAVFNLQGKDPGDFHGQYFRLDSWAVQKLAWATPLPSPASLHSPPLPSPLGIRWVSTSLSTGYL